MSQALILTLKGGATLYWGGFEEKHFLTSRSIILQFLKSKFLKFFPHISNFGL